MSENTFGFSLLKNPIYFETPRMRKFYEQNQFLDQQQQAQIVKQMVLTPQPLSEHHHNANKNYIDDIFDKLICLSNDKIECQQNSYQGNVISAKNLIDLFQSEVIENKFQQDKQMIKSIKNVITVSKNNTEDVKLQEPKTQDCIQTKKKRKRKSEDQIKKLIDEFQNEGFWSKDKILSLALNTSLSESQVYKWCWDQKKKQFEQLKKNQNNSEQDKINFLNENTKFNEWKLSFQNHKLNKKKTKLKSKQQKNQLSIKKNDDLDQNSSDICISNISKKLHF